MAIDNDTISNKINLWRSILKLEPQWKISFDIKKNSREMSEGNEDSVACIIVDLRYFLAHVQFNMPELVESELDEIVLHELLHIIVEPLACSSGCGLGEKFSEMNTILCESTIERLMPGYLELYKKAYKEKKIQKTSAKQKKITKKVAKKH